MGLIIFLYSFGIIFLVGVGVLIIKSQNGYDIGFLLALALFFIFGAIVNTVEYGKKLATISIVMDNKPPYTLVTNKDGTSEWVRTNE